MGDTFGILMRFLGRLCCCVLVLCAALVSAPHLVDWNTRYGDYVFKQLGAATGGSGAVIKAIGNIEGSLLLPKLTVHNLYVECSEDSTGCPGTLSVDRVELGIDPLSLLTGSPKVRTISVYGLRTSVGRLASIVGSQTGRDGQQLQIFDSAIAMGGAVSASATAHNVVNVKSAVVRSHGRTLLGDAVLKIGSAQYTLSSKWEHRSVGGAVDVKMTSHSTSVVLRGNSKGESLLDAFDAKLEAKTSNLSELAQTVAAITNYGVLRSVSSVEGMVLSAEIKSARDSGFEVRDLSMKSQSVSGTLELVCTKAPFCKAALNFSSIDLDALLPGGLAEQDSYANFQGSEHFALIPSWLDAAVGLDVREINYRGGASRNLMAQISVRQGRIAVDRLLLDLPGKNNHLSISGVTSEDTGSIVPRFVGALNVQGDDVDTIVSWLLPLRADLQRRMQGKKFALTGGLYLAPRIFSLLGARMYAGDTHLHGNFKYKYGKRGGEVMGDVAMSNFDIGGYGFDEDFDVKRDVMGFTWLRSVGCPVKLSVKLQDFSVGSGFVKELSFLANLSQHKISVEKINLLAVDEHGNPSDLEGRASVALSSRGMRPKVFLNLKSERYSNAFLRLPKFIERGQVRVGTSAEGDSSRGEKAERFLWSNKPIDLSSFEGLDGSVEIHVKSLSLGDRTFSDFTWLSTLKEGVMSMDKLHFTQGKSGVVNISGNIGMGEVSSLSLVVSASDMSIEANEDAQHSKVSGQISVSGSLQTQGRSMVELVNALKGKIKFAARGLDIVGIDLNGFIEDLFVAESKSEIASLARVHIYRGDTLFEKLDGESQIDRGSLTSALQFRIGNAAGSASVNLSIPQLAVVGLFRFFFIPPESESPVHMDMNLQGYVWQPNPTFDIDSLYDIVRSSR
ncbi:AsmA family protein [Anaplasma capra]|uniref:AsmA-like C-terminal region-containing protein n=1 Tax=Anaplasma capra TaxID=1562740 RepID=UPI0021D5A071|nr:AsmA-like C-terminal region-containing protein [Anaplasma capra]MCU7611251.1 hypothetical protein [Anaplasma capra]MCU7612623.1 hypothetical protein [Anaplasma capra]